MADADVDPEYTCPICLVSAICLLRGCHTLKLQEKKAPLNRILQFKSIKGDTMIHCQASSQLSPLLVQEGLCFIASWIATGMHCIFLQHAALGLQLACKSLILNRSHTYRITPQIYA